MKSVKLKKIIMIVLAVAMLMAMVPSAVFAEGTMSVELTNTAQGTITRGNSMYVSVNAKANGDLPYKLILVPGDKDLSASCGSSGTYKGKDKVEYVFNLNVLKGATVGEHVYAIRAVDPDDETIIYAKKSYYLTVEREEDAFSSMQKLSFDVDYDIDGGDSLKAGEEHTLKLYLYNRSDVTVRNCSVGVTLPTGITIKSGTNRCNVGYFNGHKTVTAEFKVIADKSIYNGSYAITISAEGVVNSVSGGYSTAVADSASQTLYIPVTGAKVKDEEDDEDDADDDKITPRLMVTSYSYGEEDVVCGNEFSLTVTLRNTSSEKKLYNIKTTVSDAGGYFIPMGSSNSFFTEEMAAGASVSHTFKMSCSSEASQGAQSVDVSMSYQDKDGTNLSSSDKISVPVVQKVRFKVDDILDPGWLTLGEQCFGSVNYYNLGKNSLSNLTISVDGDFTMEGNASYYVGNLSSGKSDYYSFNFYPNAEGPCNGTVTFAFEDASGKEYEVKKEFCFNIGPAYVYDDTGFDDMPIEPAKQGVPIWAWALVGVGAIAILIIIRKIVKKRKAKKQEALELDE